MAVADKDEVEMRKAICSILREGILITHMDNITRALDSPDLAKVLTQPLFRDRLLGTNTTGSYPTNVLFTATGNNFAVKGDLTSRTIECMQDAKCEHPEERTFKIENLIEHLRKHRVELVIDALTALRAYHVAVGSKQPVKLKPWGGFDQWSREIREPLVWLELEELADPCQTRERVASHDSQREFDSILLRQWYSAFADRLMTVATILADLREHPDATLELKRAILNVAADKNNPTEINARRFGNWCGQIDGRIIDGLRLVRREKEHQAQQWQLTRPAQDAGIDRLASADDWVVN
jgi:hypothetical protein